jgi:PBP1b-binding outer membrane lipoprotein LpoB
LNARRASGVVAAALAAATLFAACTKEEAPKVDAATERAEANKRARQDVFGAQVKAIDSAKEMPADLNQKAQDNLDKVDAMSK